MPTIAEALQLGWQRHQAGDVVGAAQIYEQVVQAAPGDENAWCFLGMARHDLGRFEEAESAYREALRLRAAFPVALSNLGNTLKALHRYDEALASFREALRWQPDYATAHNNLGVALLERGEIAAGAECLAAVVRLTPNNEAALLSLSSLELRMGRVAESEELSRRVLELNPQSAEAHKNRALAWLLQGDYERGWPEYEWRWQCPGPRLPQVPRPRWDGSPLAGRTILLHYEQGLGDTLQFIRFAKALRQGGRVVVVCQQPLVRILQGCDGIDELVPDGSPLPDCDCFAPLLSVPGLLRTTLATVPRDVPYLAADESLVRQWRDRLADIHGFKIGIAWQGSRTFATDHERSFPLACFEPLAAIPDVRLISLQRGPGGEQLAALGGQFAVIDLGDQVDTTAGPFMDTAAIMQHLDLVITCDTSLVHLAGALGVRTWLAQRYAPDFRWLLHRDDSPWYPTIRLFRQPRFQDWPSVFQRMTDELRKGR